MSNENTEKGPYEAIKKAVSAIKRKDSHWGLTIGPAEQGIRVSFYGVSPERMDKALRPLGGGPAHRDAAGNDIVIVELQNGSEDKK